jgi:hypothetical protein
MTVAEYGLYSHLREVSFKYEHVYRFDDRKIASRFTSGSKDTFNRLRHSLAKKGFVVYTGPQRKDSSGRYESQEGRILSHDEWALQHPGICITGLTDETGNQVTGLTDATGPVSPVRHKSINPNSIKHDDAAPCVFNTDRMQAARPNTSPVSPVRPAEPLSVTNTQSSPKLTRLAEVTQGQVLMKQSIDLIEGFEHLDRLPLAEVERVLLWALDEPFWSQRIVGARALRTFVRNFPTIRRQMTAVKKSPKGVLKAESVRPTGNFKYQGDIL